MVDPENPCLNPHYSYSEFANVLQVILRSSLKIEASSIPTTSVLSIFSIISLEFLTTVELTKFSL